MCGRYYIEIDDLELRELVRWVEAEAADRPGQGVMKTEGEIFPTDIVPVRTGALSYLPMKWGFTAYSNRPVINARSETVLEKPMFRRSMLERRCLIPASGYYEWRKEGRDKIKYQFSLPGSAMFFAGCYRQEKNDAPPSFVILTKPAGQGIKAIHHRMPLIIPSDGAAAWFSEDPGAMARGVEDLVFRAV